ncbi:hypothetical protein ACIREB_09315 [Streptomyces anulatus]
MSISGRGLVCTRSFARSRKQASRELDTSTPAVVAAQVESAVHALFDASPAMSRAAAAPAGDQGVSGGSWPGPCAPPAGRSRRAAGDGTWVSGCEPCSSGSVDRRLLTAVRTPS